MTWPWRHREETGEGAVAHKEATAHLAQAHARWPEVTRVSQSLRELRERNHLATQVKLIFQGSERHER